MWPVANPELVPKGLKLEQLVANRYWVRIYLGSNVLCAARVPCAATDPAGYIAVIPAP